MLKAPVTPKAAEARLLDLRLDLAQLHDESGPWDAVFITGDLAWAGEADEYQRVSEQLAEFLQDLSELGSSPVVLTVPGNHDVQKPRGAYHLN